MAGLFGLLSVPAVWSAPESVRLDPRVQAIDLSDATYLLEDPEGKLTIQDVLKPENAGRFKLGSPSIGMVTSAYWLRYALQNVSDRPEIRWFDTGNRTLQEISLYTQDSKGDFQRIDTGSTQRFSERPLPTTTFVFQVVLPPQQRTEIYLRVRSTSAMGVVLSPSIWHPSAYRESEKAEQTTWFYLLGLITALAFINLMLFAYNRDFNNLLYVGSLISMGFGFTMAVGGFGGGFQYIWPDAPLFNQVAVITGAALPNIFPNLFILHLLDLRHRRKRLLKMAYYCIGAYSALAIVQHGLIALQIPGSANFQQTLYLWGSIIFALPSLASIYCVITEVRLGNRSARFVAIAFTPFLVLMPFIAYKATSTGIILWVPILCAGVFEWFVTAIAVTDRYYQLRLERARAREALFEGLQKSERELEGKVVQRTVELAASEARAKELLHNMLPVEIANELSATGVTKPLRHESATVLFTDFHGFTQVASTMPADQMVQELDEIFAGFDDICDDLGIEKIKTIGDAYMAVGGVPRQHVDHAQRCVAAGLRMIDFVNERNQGSAFKWSLRAGVHSGPVVAGVVGKRKFAFDIWGDTVNIASRMESSGEPGRVNVSAYTYHLVRKFFVCEYRGKVDAKGKGEVDMYFVNSAIAIP